VVGLIFNSYFRVRISGLEHIPPPGVGTILAANHTSAIDVFAVGYAVGRPARFIAKVEATRYPLLGPILLNLGAIPASRDHRDTDVVRQLRATLKDGGLVGLAPEGTRSTDGRLARYDPGFIWLAVRTGAVVVPTAIHGAYQLMPRDARLPRPGPVWIRFGEPMSFAGEQPRPGKDRLTELSGQVRQRTLEMLADLVAETGIASPALETDR
jgi:1-acyl-sn-glycerol-3-phosphate acyltransferase